MVSKGVIPAILIIGALSATPAWADQDNRGRDRGQQRAQSSDQRQNGDRAVQREQGPRNQTRGGQTQRQNQAPPSGAQPRQYQAPQYQAQPRQYQAPQYQAQPRQYQAPQYQAQPRQYQGPQYQAQPRQGPQYQAPRYQAPRAEAQPRQYQAPRGDVGRGYDRAVPRQYERRDYHSVQPYYGAPRYGYGYGGRGYIAPRIIRPTIIDVIPYRPYAYRPSWSIGVYYGYNNYYPYGYTPRGYYDPIPGTLYGGLRITGMPRDAQVFADGYYVGIVNDFDGIFQHLNLEAGEHHIEIQMPGSYDPPLAFDVIVRPGQTITYRAGY